MLNHNPPEFNQNHGKVDKTKATILPWPNHHKSDETQPISNKKQPKFYQGLAKILVGLSRSGQPFYCEQTITNRPQFNQDQPRINQNETITENLTQLIIHMGSIRPRQPFHRNSIITKLPLFNQNWPEFNQKWEIRKFDHIIKIQTG